MVNPKSLVHQLYINWDFVEFLVQATRDHPTLDESQLITAIGKVKPDLPQADRSAVLRSLCNAEVLHALPRSNSFELNPLVIEFVRGLIRESDLGLSDVLKARMEAVKSSTLILNSGVEHGDMDQVRTAAFKLKELFRQISLQLEQDRHAIQEIAERAKSADNNMPISRRYRKVLTAYEDYVEPINAMMDSGASGIFYQYLVSAERALDIAVERLSIQNALYTQRLQLKHVAYQAKELRHRGRLAAQQCADTLLPLREEIRQHNVLAASVSYLLGQVRKKGLTRALRYRIDLNYSLPLWRIERNRRVSVGDEVLSIMSEARNYTPAPQPFPVDLEVEQLNISEFIDEERVYEHLRDSLPVTNLLVWLHHHYPHLHDSLLLRLYHEMVRSDEWRAVQHSFREQVNLNEIRVTHYPHQLISR